MRTLSKKGRFSFYLLNLATYVEYDNKARCRPVLDKSAPVVAM